MARFNSRSTVAEPDTVNLAGGLAHQQSPKLELVSLLLTSFAEDSFYRSAGESLDRLRELVDAIPDKKFVAKAAFYARDKFGMRSISHAAACEIARSVKGEEWTKKFFDRIVIRPDDMTEILALYMNKYAKEGTNKRKRAIPNCIKNGFSIALSRLSDYQIAKYRGDGKSVSLIDVVNLVHPKSTPAIDALMTGKLKPAETWETKLTQAGQEAIGENDEEREESKAELKKAAWKSLLKEKKLGYFALLRNLRNILEQAPDMVEEACSQLVNESVIQKSRVLPFRFQTAMTQFREIEGLGAKKIRSAINSALDLSLQNVPVLPGSTLVALDGSGSMQGRPIEIGSLFAAVIAKSQVDADLIVFSNNAKYVSVEPKDTTLTISDFLQKNCKFGGTNFHSIFQTARKEYDRVIILSDMQAWMGINTPKEAHKEFRKKYGCDPSIYSFDLNGKGTMQFPEPKIYALAGFSEKIFDVMKLLEQDRQALIHAVEAVEL